LHLLADRLKLETLNQQLEKNVDVLWESQKVLDTGRVNYQGYTPNFCRVETQVDNTVLLESQIKKTHLNDILPKKGVLTGNVI
ncbi:MAG: tRNA (N(6)-L-threonylcarbamoyladenosine(37)-C(2))-methylthiotransferase MtaB, partial [Cocleimonas sp.]